MPPPTSAMVAVFILRIPVAAPDCMPNSPPQRLARRPLRPRLLARLHLPDGQPRQMMPARHRCRAMSGASTARSQHGAASRNAWRPARDFLSGCGGPRTAVRITARRPAKRYLKDIGWPGVTVARLIPRSLFRCQRRCPLCSANAFTASRRTSLRTRSHARSCLAGYG